MISPYIRRLRLAKELRRLRSKPKLSSDALARAVGLPRTTISRLENARMRPDEYDVMKILERLGVTGTAWSELMAIAKQAAEHGWWESFGDEMGARQALYANLEAGASKIREFQMTLLPGLLQTAAFCEARAAVDQADWSARFSPARAVEARLARQKMLHRPGGPGYEVIIDEWAIRRPAAEPETLHDQLLHTVGLAIREPEITVRVLPVDVPIKNFTVPRSGFSIYDYPDPGDPVAVAVDTVTDDLVLTEPEQVAHYLTLYGRLLDAALTPDDSVRFLRDAADRIPTVTGRAA
jgi:transcriptional regulator with XRE-family HTH domain